MQEHAPEEQQNKENVRGRSGRATARVVLCAKPDEQEQKRDVNADLNAADAENWDRPAHGCDSPVGFRNDAFSPTFARCLMSRLSAAARPAQRARRSARAPVYARFSSNAKNFRARKFAAIV